MNSVRLTGYVGRIIGSDSGDDRVISLAISLVQVLRGVRYD